MNDKRRYWFVIDKGKLEYVQDNVTGEKITVTELEDLLNEQLSIIRRDEISIQTMMSNMEKLEKENEQLKKAEKINMEYAEQIVEENKKLRIAKNDLRKENEQLQAKIEMDKNDFFISEAKRMTLLA